MSIKKIIREEMEGWEWAQNSYTDKFFKMMKDGGVNDLAYTVISFSEPIYASSLTSYETLFKEYGVNLGSSRFIIEDKLIYGMWIGNYDNYPYKIMYSNRPIEDLDPSEEKIENGTFIDEYHGLDWKILDGDILL